MTVTLDAFSGSGGGGGGTGAGMPDSTVRQRGSAVAVATDAETTVVSRTTPLGFTFKLAQVIATGSAAAEWIVYDDSTEVYRTRTSASEQAVDILHGNALPFASGHTCTLKVVHEEPSVRNFYGSLLGRDE